VPDTDRTRPASPNSSGGKSADIRNLGVLLLSHQQYHQSRLGHEIYRLWGHRILRLRERSHRLQRDDARGHFRQIRRSDYEAARSIRCWNRVLRFRSQAASHPTLANFMTFVLAYILTLAFFNLNSRVGFCGFWLIDDSFTVRCSTVGACNARLWADDGQPGSYSGLKSASGRSPLISRSPFLDSFR